MPVPVPVLCVFTSADGLPPETLTVSSYSAVLEQSEVAYRRKRTDPPAARLPELAVTVAVSFGIQSCFVLTLVGICRTITFSLSLGHGESSVAAFVFGESPGYAACQ